MYNYWTASAATTFIDISAWISECKFILTLNTPSALISFVGWINEGFISSFIVSKINFEISVGFTDPYNSLFSVLNFLTENILPLIFSKICFASLFFSRSFLSNSDLIFSTSLIFSFYA